MSWRRQHLDYHRRQTTHEQHPRGHFDRSACSAGVYFRDFLMKNKATWTMLPSYPASRDLCTIGGMFAQLRRREEPALRQDGRLRHRS